MASDMLSFNLRREELARLRGLMAGARFQRLSWSEEAELRQLISKQSEISPSLPWDEVVHTGLLIVGLYALAQDLGDQGVSV